MRPSEGPQAMPRRVQEYTQELLKAFPSGQVVNREGSVLDLPFKLPSGRPTALRVSLPSHFPYDRPVLCVLIPLQHPAVDATGRVRVPSVDSWGATGGAAGTGPRDLVAVVREAFDILLGAEAARQQGLIGDIVVHALQRDAARIISLAGGMGPYGTGTAPTGAGLAARGGAGVGERDPTAFLEGLSTRQLEAMLDDEEALRRAAVKWLQETPAARALEDVRRQNRSVAETNLALGRSIEEARNQVAVVRSSEYTQCRALFEVLYKRQEAVVAKLGIPKLLARVRAEADEVDAASDDLLERFQSGGLSVESFVESYMSAREAFHTVDIKRQAAEHTTLA